MQTDRIINFIDNKVKEKISEGCKLCDIIIYLESNSERFKKRDTFINVSKKYLITNWNLIPFAKRYTAYYIIHSDKRKCDIEWLLKNKDKFKGKTDEELFKLIILKDKIKYKFNSDI